MQFNIINLRQYDTIMNIRRRREGLNFFSFRKFVQVTLSDKWHTFKEVRNENEYYSRVLTLLTEMGHVLSTIDC